MFIVLASFMTHPGRQPSKNDPTKVKVDWSTIIKNAR